MLRSRHWIVPCVTLSLFHWQEAPALACGCTVISPDLGVNATIFLSCTITTTPLSFGAYDPIGQHHSAALDSTGGLQVTCNEGLNATISLGQGLYAGTGSTGALPIRQMSDGNGNLLSYTVNQDAARLLVWGDTQATSECTSGSISVYGRIPGGQNAVVGTYSDTILVLVIL
jgi:spore coat protein U-like protein